MYFKPYHKADVLAHTSIRRFETKLGEVLEPFKRMNESVEECVAQLSAKFVILGVVEDIGVKANYGMGGTGSAWVPFLQQFCNIQSNDFLMGNDIAIAGHFDFSQIQALIEKNAHTPQEKVEAYRLAVNTIDDEVEKLIKLLVQHGKIPIVIGGGHNNAYPCLKGAAKALHKQGKIPLSCINAINLDAHADYRPQEGRHSGNAFRYAEADGYLQKYCVVGLQENTIAQNVWSDIVNNPFIDLITYEDIFIHEKRSFLQAVHHAIDFTNDGFVGIELDVDAIENTLCSASSPAGVSVQQARQYITLATKLSNVAYVHICEGAASLTNGQRSTTIGKLISFLTADAIKAMLEE